MINLDMISIRDSPDRIEELNKEFEDLILSRRDDINNLDQSDSSKDFVEIKEVDSDDDELDEYIEYSTR